MMKRWFLIPLTFSLLTGCTQQSAADSGTEQTQTVTIAFTDDLGNEITMEKPQRVAALIGSFADLWADAGGLNTLVAAAHDTWTSFDLDLEDVTDLGEIKNPNVEALLASEPDLVLASAKNSVQTDLAAMLEDTGIPVAYFDVSSFSDYLNMLSICTKLTGDEQMYQENGLNQEAEIEKAMAMADGSQPTVLYLRAAGSSVKAKNSEGTVLGEMLADLDTVNIADSQSSLLEDLSMEAIVEQDPEFIFLIAQGSDNTKAQALLEETLYSNPLWNELSAVQNNRVYVLDQSLYNLKPNARWAEAYTNLAEILYGEE